VTEYLRGTMGGVVSGVMGDMGEIGETGVIGLLSWMVAVGMYRYESTGSGKGGDGSGVLYGRRGGLSGA
jgi:hypothetical protein